MKPLLVLIISFLCAAVVVKLFHIRGGFEYAGRIAMAIMLMFTAIGHFAFTKGMTMMVPASIPYKKQLVYITGFMEIGFAIALLSAYYEMIGMALIIFFLLLLPANIYAAINKVDHEKGTYNGKDKGYLKFRIPLQLFFILWVYICAVA